jgi:putative phosphoribosyl transferase
MSDNPYNILELPELRDQIRTFRSRDHAGRVVAGMLGKFKGTDSLILAIPSGGVPVGVAIAEELNLALEAAVVSKITLPWNTEAGYGAVAFDGTVRINEDLLPHLRLSEQQIAEGVEKTRQKVQRRVKKFLGERPFPDLSRKAAILVDDGLASGFTLLVAAAAVRRLGSREIIVAVPTGSADRVLQVAREVDALYCANIREGWGFSVAEAYRRWMDVEEEEAVRLFRDYQTRFQQAPIPPRGH